MSTDLNSQAAAAYDRLAPYYDAFTAGYAHEKWVGTLESRARTFGLNGNRALDVACGTGKSTVPLIARGYNVVACDVSEEMLRQARRKLPNLAESFVLADMRQLPRLGEFDLVLCLDDALNYLLSEAELEATFSGIADCLALGGVFVFDLNSLRTYRGSFSQTRIRESDGIFFAWRGESAPSFAHGETASARVEVFSEREDGLWERDSGCHEQRHYPPELVRAALEQAGLECCAILGQRPGAELEDTFDENDHIKLVYFARLDIPGADQI